MRLRLLLPILLAVLTACGATAGDMTYVLVTFRDTPLGVINAEKTGDFAELTARSATGLMNSRTAGRTCFQNVAATIAAGRRVSVYPEKSKPAPIEYYLKTPPVSPAALAGHPYFSSGCIAEQNERLLGEAADGMYLRATGRPIPPGAMVNPGAERLARTEQSIDPAAQPGLLADTLQDGGVKIALYGCSSFDGRGPYARLPYRPSYLLGCGSDGLVTGEHSDCLSADRQGPLGLTTDYDDIVARVSRARGTTFVVVEAGDLLRLTAEKSLYSPGRYKVALTKTRRRLYDFLADLDRALRGSGNTYRVCALSLEQSGQTGALLPVLIYGSDIKSECLLTSRSTKRPGIIACVDVTQDVFSFFGIDCPTAGFAPEVCPGDADTLTKEANRMLLTYRARPTVVIIFVTLTGICALSLLTCLIFYRRLPEQIRSLVKTLTIAVMLIPLGVFVSPALNVYSLEKTGLFYLLFALAGSLLLRRLSTDKIILTVCSVTSLVIMADTLTGSWLSKRSLLSYDPMVGARFYGLGNEYAGILLACSMLTIYMLWQRFARVRAFAVPVAAAALAVIMTIGLPGAGTNFGGMVAAILGFACAGVMSVSLKPDLKTVIGGVICALALVPLMIYLNVQDPQSHIGRFFSVAMQGDSALVLTTVTRKLAMNITLIQASRWVWVLISCLVFLIVILFNPRGLTRQLFDGRRILNAGFCGLIFGLTVGFAVNDSGVVMMATGIMYLTYALALLLLKTAEEEAPGA